MKRQLYIFILLIGLLCFTSSAVEFTGPAGWKLVSTNAVAKWQESFQKQVGDDYLALKGVVADKKKNEVRLLAEAVGHGKGTTTEFMLVGPASDRAYEATAVTVADPGDIVKAVEFIGIRRGSCVDGVRFKFVPFGERFNLFYRVVDGKSNEEHPFRSLLKEVDPDDPLLSDKGFVFAGGEWELKDGNDVCITGTVPPCSVVSLYNERTIFDIPQQAGQSEAYGRLNVAVDLPYGTLLEIIARPVATESTLATLQVTASTSVDQLQLHMICKKAGVDQKAGVKESVGRLRELSESGKDIFVTLGFDGDMKVTEAREVAALFEILNGTGIRMYGKGDGGVYFKAFLPQDSWRNREGRNPQPFEVHITRGKDGALDKKLVFIEEDWSVEGLDPKLTPKEFPFKEWNELESLVIKSGGRDNRVGVLFIFVPGDMPLKEFMPGVNILSKRLPLVHIFAE